ncbi:hypothetical protein GCM10025871_12170 [Deinococcus metallilatus]|nr:hypothetical protein GCM10025871_12170 [Deinococcus metallilatus]
MANGTVRVVKGPDFLGRAGRAGQRVSGHAGQDTREGVRYWESGVRKEESLGECSGSSPLIPNPYFPMY